MHITFSTKLRQVAVTVGLFTGIGLASASGVYVSTQAAIRPVVFAPGVISGPANDDAPAFAPDGRTVYFFRSNYKDYDILVSQFDGTNWSRPRIASFSGQWRDLEPAMAPDGSYLIFASSRPVDGSNKPMDGHWGGNLHAGRGGNLWRVNRTASGWSKPSRLPDMVNRWDSTFGPTVASDGTLYFMAGTGKNGRFQLYRASIRNGTYQQARPMPFSTGEWGDSDPVIAPDQSFFLFSSDRPPTPAHGSDVFIVFRDSSGQWGEPIDLGPVVNDPSGINELRLGADGHTLYFSSNRVVPPGYPKTLAESRRGLQQMQMWNNGRDNIWMIDLTPWLKCRGRPACRTSHGWPR